MAACLCTAFKVQAQTNNNYSLWLGYQARKPIAKKFNWNSDFQFRLKTRGAAYDYTLIRTGIQYEPNDHFNVNFGVLYGQDNTSDKSLPVWKNEKRLWQDCRWLLGDMAVLQLGLQFRLEERWFTIKTKNGGEDGQFAWRFRHRAELRKEWKSKWRGYVGNEYMLQYATSHASFNQNRIWTGIGKVVGKNNEIQAQLMRIIWKSPDATVLRINFLHQL